MFLQELNNNKKSRQFGGCLLLCYNRKVKKDIFMKKLLIWDFDGVIADSEKLWVRAWDEILRTEKNIILTDKEKETLLVGVSDKTRRERLQSVIPNLILDDDFMNKIGQKEIYLGTNFMTAIDGVEKVMSNDNFEHCIATGATKEQHAWKMTQFKWIEKYINPKDFYTVDMVEHGKPEPDLFLLAASSKGYNPKDCIVIGDSINDFIAARGANMACIAFIGATGNDTQEYAEKCKSFDVFGVCSIMEDVNKTLDNWYNKIG